MRRIVAGLVGLVVSVGAFAVIADPSTARSVSASQYRHGAGFRAIDLGTLGGSFSSAVAISPSGQVIGYAAEAGDASYHAFSWTSGSGMVDLGTLGGTYSYANAVSPSGQVVGYSNRAGSAASEAFSWTQAGGWSTWAPWAARTARQPRSLRAAKWSV